MTALQFEALLALIQAYAEQATMEARLRASMGPHVRPLRAAAAELVASATATARAALVKELET